MQQKIFLKKFNRLLKKFFRQSQIAPQQELPFVPERGVVFVWLCRGAIFLGGSIGPVVVNLNCVYKGDSRSGVLFIRAGANVKIISVTFSLSINLLIFLSPKKYLSLVNKSGFDII